MKRTCAVPVVLAGLLFLAGCDYAKSGGPVLPLAPTEVNSPVVDPAAPPRLSGREVVAIVAARYPEKLVAGVSLEERKANMAFLRDRIIEEGTCNGLLLAWNRKKRGARSIDAINWRHGKEDINDVVDIAAGYDDTRRPLRLHWLVVAGPAGWDPYPAHPCPAG